MEPPKLRPPTPTFERVKLALILVAFIALSEIADPFPTRVTLPIRVAVALLILVVLRGFHHARLEVDEGWAARTRTMGEWWRARRDRLPREAWLKLQRLAIWLAAAYAFGTILNVLTDKCDSAVQCVMLAPRMAIENVPTFLQYAIYMAISLLQIGFMFIALIKVGSFKLVMPGPQPLDAKVLTPGGWRKMGEIQKGDHVISIDGTPTEVLKTYDMGEEDVYRITFSDGASTEATGGHPWEVRRHWQHGRGGGKVVSTLDLRTAKRYRDSIPIAGAVEYPEVDLPLPPYTMGALLGDGSLSGDTPVIEVNDAEILDFIEAEGVALRRRTTRDGAGHRATLYHKNPYAEALRDLGVWGLKARHKFIPDPYLQSSVRQRRALLAGLLDTDGSLRGRSRRSRNVTFYSTSERLADGVIELARSLGGTASRHWINRERPYYEVRILVPFNPFWLERKAEGWTQPRCLTRRVVAVELVGRKEVKCLLVEHPRHLYVTDDFVVTHNTIDVTFDDVWGQDAAKERVLEQVKLLEDSEEVERAGGYLPKGILLHGPPGTGKGQPVSAMVMTPGGPRRMGDLAVGDEVIGADGYPTKVLGVHELGERDLFRVSFSDGSSLEVTEDHWWEIETLDKTRRLIETKELVAQSPEELGEAGYRIPMVAPVQFESANLPIDPYLLGLQLGGGLLESLEDLGMHQEEFIPPEYLYSDVGARLSLLQGLMDSGGHATPSALEFTMPARGLSTCDAVSVRLLVESLGGTVTPAHLHGGVEWPHSPAYTLRLALPPDVTPFRLAQKALVFRSRAEDFPGRRIVSAAPAGRREAARCISVEADDGLYVTERYIVTHNTLLAKAAANYSSKPLILIPPGAFVSPQPLDTPTLTPNGWTTMGALEPGDFVVGRHGHPARVVGVYDRGDDEVYELTFSDGAKTRATADHLWRVQRKWDQVNASVIVPTRELRVGKYNRDSVPLPEPIEFSPSKLPIPPYTMGAMLGGGTFRGETPTIACYDAQILDEMEGEGVAMRRSEFAEQTGELVHRANLSSGPTSNENPVAHELKRLGLWRLESPSKFVPQEYLFGSVEQRRAVLAGLLDVGGTVNRGAGERSSRVIYTTSSEHLARDVVHLVRSLGGLAKAWAHAAQSGAPRWRVQIQLGTNPFRLARKAALWRAPTRMSRRIEKVESVGTGPVRCLLLDDPEHLYVTSDFIVTHNTFLGINLLKVWTLFRNVRKLARRYGGCIVFLDEIDSLGSRGGDVERGTRPARAVGCVPLDAGSDDPAQVIVTGGSQGMGTLEAFLAAMDGLDEPRGLLNRTLVFLGFKPLRAPEYRYLFIAATNMIGRLDPALLRAGRFGRKIHVTFPKVDGRRKTYEGYLSKVQHALSPEDIEWAARSHANGTGAEIQDIVNEALLITYRDGRDDPGRVKFDDLMRAMVWVKFGESDGPFERPEGRWAVAVHEAGHAVAFHHLNRHRQRIWFGSCEQRSRAGGMVAPTPIREDWLLTRSELLADIQVSLASRVAEELVLGEPTNGHGGDGQAATERAAQFVRYGLLDQVGAHPADSKEFRRSQEVVLREALDAARALLEPRVPEIEAVARLLEERGTVSGDEIHALLDSIGEANDGEST